MKMNKQNKKGSEMYYIIISLILGLILIGIVFSWIYQEYFFGEDELKLQQCRESIFTRSKIPHTEWKTINPLDLKEKYPLKCETNIITINEGNQENAEKIISDAIAACWALYDEGRVDLYHPDFQWATAKTSCFTCARIHFDVDVNISTKEMFEEGPIE